MSTDKEWDAAHKEMERLQNERNIKNKLNEYTLISNMITSISQCPISIGVGHDGDGYVITHSTNTNYISTAPLGEIECMMYLMGVYATINISNVKGDE